MRSIVHMGFLLCFLAFSPAYASDEISQYVPDAQKVGDGRLTFMFWDVYDAALFAPEGQWSDNKPFALKLSYLRNLSGLKIADKSIEEIRKQGFSDELKLADWHSQLRKIIPDVDSTTSLIGIYTQEGVTIFIKGAQEIGRIVDPSFGPLFFDIWLGEKTTAPELRKQLLGET